MALHLVAFEFVAGLDGKISFLLPGLEPDLPPLVISTLRGLVHSTGLPRAPVHLGDLLAPPSLDLSFFGDSNASSTFVAHHHKTTAFKGGEAHHFCAVLRELAPSQPQQQHPETSLVVVERAIVAEDGAVTAFKGIAIIDPDRKGLTPYRAELYLAELVTAKAVVDAATACPPASVPHLADTVARLTDAVVDIFDQHLRNHLPDGADRWHAVGRAAFAGTVRFYVERSMPIRFVLPAFPCKSPNTESKVLGKLPDLGEELALRTMDFVGKMIKQVYPPGVSFLIVSDGHVFSDLLGVDDDAVVQYGDTVRAMSQTMGLSSPFGFRGLDDLLLMPTNSSADLARLGLDELVLEQPLDSLVTPDANRARRILQATGGSSEEFLKKEIKEDPEVTTLYRGFSRFLLEDLNHPSLAKLPSKNARKKLCTRLAFLMIMRNRAYSAMVALVYPLHVRISIHPHPNAGPKFGIRLIHPTYLYRGEQAAAKMELFHTPTPWHNCIVRDSNGAHILMHRNIVETAAKAKNRQYRIVQYPDGRPSHIQIECPFVELFPESAPEPSEYGSIDTRKQSQSSDGNAPLLSISRAPSTTEYNSEVVTVVGRDIEAGATPVPKLPSPSQTPKAAPEYSAYSAGRRRLFLLLVASAGFLGPLSGNIYLSALEAVRKDMDVSVSMINLTVTMFMLMFALAPLGWATLADSYGRRIVYITSLPVYIAANIGLFFTHSYPMLMALRIVQAIGAAAVQSVGAGTLADIFQPKERGSAMSLFLLGPQLGPVVGPVAGGLIAQYLGWRWMFVLLAAVGTVVWLAIFCCLPETLRSRTRNGTTLAQALADSTPAFRLPTRTADAPKPQPGAKKPSYNPFAPLAFLAVPAIAICVAAVAAIFGTFYAVTVEVPAAFSSLYGFSSLAVGLAYLGLGVGFVAGSLAGGRAADRLLAAEMKRLGTTNAKDVPTEIRVRSAAVGIVVFPVGVLLFGISLEFAWHPAAVIACMFVLAFGMTWTFSCTTTYLVDSYPGSAAGIVALNSLFRNPAAAAGSAIIAPLITAVRPAASFAVFASTVVIAAVALVPVVVYGQRWREEYRKKNDKSKTTPAPAH